MSKYVCFNGEFKRLGDFRLNTENRAFRYGDGLFETIHANGTIPQFINLHLERLVSSMQLLKMNVPASFTPSYFSNRIQGLLTRNKQFMGARVRLTVFRNDGGLYTPATANASWLLESVELDSDRYYLNEKGYVIDLFTDIRKPLNALSQIKSTSALLYVMAGLFKQRANLDDCLLLNEKGNMCEAMSSNIFIVRERKVFTPPINEGCLPGIMRQVVMNIIRTEGGLELKESSLTLEELLEAEELFLTNTISGIRWVMAYKHKRFFNTVSKKLAAILATYSHKEIF